MQAVIIEDKKDTRAGVFFVFLSLILLLYGFVFVVEAVILASAVVVRHKRNHFVLVEDIRA
jgi:hypothetical protein